MKMCFFAFHHVMTLPPLAFFPWNKQNNKKTHWKEICSFKLFSRYRIFPVQMELAKEASRPAEIDCWLFQEQFGFPCSVVDTTGLRAPASQLTEGKAGHHVLCCKNEGRSLLLQHPSCWRGGDLLRCSRLSACSSCSAELQACGEVERLYSTAHTVSEAYGESISWKEENQTPFSFLEGYNGIPTFTCRNNTPPPFRKKKSYKKPSSHMKYLYFFPSFCVWL